LEISQKDNSLGCQSRVSPGLGPGPANSSLKMVGERQLQESR